MNKVSNTGRLSHDDLALDLAGHLRCDNRMTWCDMQLGPQASPRPDVFAIYKSYSNPCPVAYECKVSVSDFRSDVTSGKWQQYLKFASGVYFACEGNLISKSDVPTHCGLIIRGESGSWRAAKKAVLSPVCIPEEAWLKLLIDGVEREGPQHRARRWSESVSTETVRKKFGDLVAKAVRDRLAVEYEIEQAKQMAERIEADARHRAERIRTENIEKLAPLRVELCGILGLKPDTRSHEIGVAVKKLRLDLADHPANAALKSFTKSVENALSWYGFKEPVVTDSEEPKPSPTA